MCSARPQHGDIIAASVQGEFMIKWLLRTPRLTLQPMTPPGRRFMSNEMYTRDSLNTFNAEPARSKDSAALIGPSAQ